MSLAFMILLCGELDFAFAVPSYKDGCHLAYRSGRPLVCWVGCEPLPLAGVETAYEPGSKPCVWVCWTDGRNVWWESLPATATETDIRAAIARVSPRPAQAGTVRSGNRIPAAPVRGC